MSFIDIQAALATRLNTVAGLPAIYWPGVKETPTNGTDFVRPTLIPATSELIVLNSKQDNSGIYQVDVFIDHGEGEGPLITIVDAIKDHFKAATTLTQNTTIVFIKNISILPMERDEAWLRGGVEIVYKSIENF
tara:strand:- start:1839 stop:2240 length:402 start_codon:yes stop_codon:yes gene_type:complete